MKPAPTARRTDLSTFYLFGLNGTDRYDDGYRNFFFTGHSLGGALAQARRLERVSLLRMAFLNARPALYGWV